MLTLYLLMKVGNGMGIFDYFKKKKSPIGNYELIQRVLPYKTAGLSDEAFIEKVKNEANIEFANGGLDKIPTDKEINDLAKLIKISQTKSDKS